MQSLGIGLQMRIIDRKNKCFGFTLVEVLVVIIIISIVATIAIVSMGLSPRHREFVYAVETMMASIKMAEQEAMLLPAVLKLHITSKGYIYTRYHFNVKSHQWEWIRLSDDVVSRISAFPFPVRVNMVLKNRFTTNQSVHHFLLDNPNKDRGVSILILPSGSITPGKLIISNYKRTEMLALELQFNGAAQLLALNVKRK